MIINKNARERESHGCARQNKTASGSFGGIHRNSFHKVVVGFVFAVHWPVCSTYAQGPYTHEKPVFVELWDKEVLILLD